MVLGQSASFFLLDDVLHFLGTLEVALRPVASRQSLIVFSASVADTRFVVCVFS